MAKEDLMRQEERNTQGKKKVQGNDKVKQKWEMTKNTEKI